MKWPFCLVIHKHVYRARLSALPDIFHHENDFSIGKCKFVFPFAIFTVSEIHCCVIGTRIPNQKNIEMRCHSHLILGLSSYYVSYVNQELHVNHMLFKSLTFRYEFNLFHTWKTMLVMNIYVYYRININKLKLCLTFKPYLMFLR